MVRYPYYVANLTGNVSYAHKWLRYSLFVPLYPLGIVAEMGVLVLSIPALQREGLFGVADFTLVGSVTLWMAFIGALLSLYIPGFPVMYKYMQLQRQKNLKLGRFAESKRH